MSSDQKNRIFGISLSFLAGYVDTLGFVALFGLFTAHITGNFVVIGAVLSSSSNASVLLKLLAFPAFILGIAGTRLLAVAAERSSAPAFRLALGLQMILLAGFMIFGYAATPITRQDSILAIVAGLLGAAGMGVHSAIAKLMLSHLAPTSMMTGNMTQFVIDSVDVLRGAGDAALSARCGKFFWPLAAFGAGAIIGAFAYHAVGFPALLVPIAIIGVLLFAGTPVAVKAHAPG
jgi:uncharacterized membrane protein YoaK (UPF0700 family)